MASSLPLNIPPNRQIKPQLLAGLRICGVRELSFVQCVGSRRVCILLPVWVTTSELCGVTLVTVSVIRGPQARCSIAAEDYVRHYNV